DGIPTALYAKMAELGWMGLIVPEAEGGLGLGVLELALVLEELGRVAAPGPFLGSQLVTAALLRAGTRTQRRTWVPRLVAGEAFGALAYLEESDRHDPAGITLRARRTREGYRLSGTKIGSFQAIKHMAAEMAAEVEPTRSLVWYAAYGFDHRLREAPRAAAIAKARLGEVYCRTVERSLQIHGGIGFTWEHDLHLWFKRARWNQVAFGDPTFHRERLATIDGY